MKEEGYLLKEFKKQESDLIIRAINFNSSLPFIVIPFFLSNFNLACAKFSNEENRFIEINTLEEIIEL